MNKKITVYKNEWKKQCEMKKELFIETKFTQSLASCKVNSQLASVFVLRVCLRFKHFICFALAFRLRLPKGKCSKQPTNYAMSLLCARHSTFLLYVPRCSSSCAIFSLFFSYSICNDVQENSFCSRNIKILAAILKAWTSVLHFILIELNYKNSLRSCPNQCSFLKYCSEKKMFSPDDKAWERNERTHSIPNDDLLTK